MSNTLESKKTLDTRKKSPYEGLTKEELRAKFKQINLDYNGRMEIDDVYKHPDKVLRIDRGDSATRKQLLKLGYTPVMAIDGAENGSGSLSESHGLGSEVHFEMGISKGADPGILYECSKMVYDVRHELDAEANDRQLQNTIEEVKKPD